MWTGSEDIKTGYTFDDGYLYFNFYQVRAILISKFVCWYVRTYNPTSHVIFGLAIFMISYQRWYFTILCSSGQGDDCANQIVAVEGQLTNKCLLMYGDDNATPTGSLMYACDNGK